METINQITGMIAVHDDAALNARLDYAIDTSTDKVTYTITCQWKQRSIYRTVPFRNYRDASDIFDGLVAVSRSEIDAGNKN